MRFICDALLGDFQWFALVKDSTYVNVAALTRALNKLTASKELIICE